MRSLSFLLLISYHAVVTKAPTHNTADVKTATTRREATYICSKMVPAYGKLTPGGPSVQH